MQTIGQVMYLIYTPLPLMDSRNEIKARLPIEQLVGEYCQLIRKGRNYASLCPFHNDTHPSFLISPDKGIAYCFACQTGGDIFNFYQAIEGVDFPQAIRDLAEKTGVELPKEKISNVKKGEKERLRECLEACLTFYAERLQSSNEAKAYLSQRDIPLELQRMFGIGYAPDSYSETYDHLLKKNFTSQEIVGAGIAVQKDLEGRVYDRFRHRVMFPILDAQGEIVGFGGRTLREGEAKYVNSPEGPLYHKSSVLYGFSHAKESVRKLKRVVLVEGYFDVLACHKAGITNVAAVSGTALTEQHGKLLKRYSDHAGLCLDQDRAGQDAAVRAFHVLTKQNISVNAIKIPAKDPDEFAKTEPGLFAKLVRDGGVPFIDQVLHDIGQTSDLSTPQAKRSAAATLLVLVRSLDAAVERDAYLEKIAHTIGANITALRDDLSKLDHEEKHVSTREVIVEKTPFDREELCLGLGLLYGEQRALLGELITPDKKDYAALHEALKSDGKTVGAVLIESLDIPTETKEWLFVLVLFCEENFGQWSQSAAAREIKKLCKAANRQNLGGKQKKIIEQLKAARLAGRHDEEAQLLTQYSQALKLAKMAS